LFADFVGSDAIQEFMAFYWDGLKIVGVNGMIATFPEKRKAIFFQVPMRSRRLTDIGKVHGKLFDQGIAEWDFLALLPIGQDHFV
jgi:hypothetical protein